MARPSKPDNSRRTVPTAPLMPTAAPPSAESDGTLLPSTLVLPKVTAEPLGVASVPRWKRANDSKMRKKVAKILVLKLAGRKTSDIAKRLETTPETIRHYLYIAGKNGWLSQDGLGLADPAEQLAYEAGAKVARNVSHALDGKLLLPQQFDMTVEAAKGLGYFKNHSAIKQEGTISIPNLEVNIMMPQGAITQSQQQIDPATFGGQPGYVDGQVLDESAQKQLTNGD